DWRLVRQFGQTEPEYVHRRSGFDRFEASELAEHGETTVSANRERRTNFVFPIRTEISDASNDAILFNQMLNLSLHHQVELVKLRSFGSDEFQETALGNHQDVWETCWQALEFEGTKRTVGKLNRRTGNFGVWNFVEFLGETNLVQDFEDRWMN